MSTLKETFTDIADAIREKDGSTRKIKPSDMPAKIKNIPSITAESSLKEYFDYKKSAVSFFMEDDPSSAKVLTYDILKDIISYNDTSNVTSTSNMFSGCSLLTTIPELNTSNVTSMNSMFYGCSGLITIPQLDTSKVTDMYYMFK